MSDETKQMSLRLPAPLHDRLVRQAEKNRRSAHAQILVYVEDGLDVDESGEQES